MKAWLAAMIIGMGTACAAAGADGVRLPDPTTFAVRLESGDVAQARQWLDAGLDPNFAGSRIGTGLMIGAWEGNIELMSLFLARGADINRVNNNGETALALAAWNGRMDAVQWLLDKGARINNSRPRQWSALHYAVFAGHKDLANFLMDRGADINAVSTNGSSVLMMAIYEGRDDLARTLIEKGARRDVKNDWGDGALEWAMRFNRLDIARLIATAPEFKAAMNEPKEKWGESKRSAKMSPELEQLLRAREILVEKGMSVDTIDERIAAERARIVRAQVNRNALPPRAATLEITASRKAPQEQSANIVYDAAGKPLGYKNPPATFSGQARMPPKVPVKNY